MNATNSNAAFDKAFIHRQVADKIVKNGNKAFFSFENLWLFFGKKEKLRIDLN